jgi:hypothetical protein
MRLARVVELRGDVKYMADRLPIDGPYRMVEVAGGEPAPFYIIPFDDDGVCSGPRTRQKLLETAAAGGFTNLFLFSHGWNNTWPSAIKRYESFIAGFAGLRAEHPLSSGRAFRPLLVGVFWPSAVLVETDEQAPAIAGEPAVPAEDAAVADERRDVEEVAQALDPTARARFYELAQLQQPTRVEALDLAELVAPLWAGGGDAGGGPTDEVVDDLGSVPDTLSPEQLVEVWALLDLAASDAGNGGVTLSPTGRISLGLGSGGPSPAAPGTAPAAAGLFDGIDLSKLNPRNLVRGTTVWLMKDRSGRVGARGVHDLLDDLLASSEAQLHLIGHSYGCKVALSALCSRQLTRPVESVLLLQPACSHLCFAADVPGLGQPGGYRNALEPGRCRQPVMATLSSHDRPLTRDFHLFVRRRSDLGEVVIAGRAPSRYAALGGFGPDGVEGQGSVLPATDPGQPYRPDTGARVVGVESSRVISDHSDVSNRWTWWMLLDQVGRGS